MTLQLQRAGLSLWWLLLLWSMGSRAHGLQVDSVVAVSELYAAAAAAKSLQSCPTLCDPRGGTGLIVVA